MRLIIGGRFSGKYDYLCELGFSPDQIGDGETQSLTEVFEKPAVYRLESLIKRLLREGRDPLADIWEACRFHPSVTVVCDEVGCGVVPADAFERAYREQVGRVCLALAKESALVERVYCGIPTRLR